MDIITALVAFIAAVLDIILFFKIWGMTNDIRALKKDHFDARMPEDVQQLRAYLRNNIVLGEKEKAKRILINEFLDNINNKCNAYRSSYLDTNKTILDTDITPYVELLGKQLAKINVELPEEISALKTYRDYYEMYKNEDFEV